MSDIKDYKSQHFTRIFKKLNEDRKTDGKYCDVDIKSDSSTFPAHKNIIAMFCDFMEKLFMSEMKEKYTSFAELKSLRGEALEEIMNFIYTEKISLSRENVFDIHTAADYMQIPEIHLWNQSHFIDLIGCPHPKQTKLLEFCCDYLVEKLSLESCITTLVYAQLYQADDIIQKALNFISGNLQRVLADESFLGLSFENVNLILQRRENCSEEEVYNSIMAWTKHDEENRKNHFDDLFVLIDFSKLSASFFLSKLSASFLETTVNDEKLVVNLFGYMKALVAAALDKGNFSQSTSDQSQTADFAMVTPVDGLPLTTGKPMVPFMSRERQWTPVDRLPLTTDEDLELINIYDAQNMQIYYGTTYARWNSSESGGISRDGNDYITFVKGMNRNKLDNYEIAIKINVELAIEAGLKFYIDSQSNVLSPGNRNGKILPRFFSFAKVLNPNERFFENGESESDDETESTYSQSSDEDLELIDICDAKNMQIYYGTTYARWNSSESGGISRDGNDYITFVKGMNRNKLNNYEIAIKINVELAIEVGLKFYIDSQRNVLSPGNRNGKILPRFFSFAKDLNTNERFFENDE